MTTLSAPTEYRPLVISESEIRRNGPGNLLGVCWRQWRTERRLARRGVLFRTTDLDAVGAAYSAMSEAEFEAINGRQDWANWRTVARSMSGLAPDRPLRVVDLGCGTGGSTRVLAFYAPAGSRVIGYELARPLVDIARRRTYRTRSGAPASVEFVCQGVTETLRDIRGAPLPDGSIDLASASGIVGHHLDESTLRDLAAELRRVLAPGGFAFLDPGGRLPDERLSAVVGEYGFERIRRSRSCAVDRYGQVCYRMVEKANVERPTSNIER